MSEGSEPTPTVADHPEASRYEIHVDGNSQASPALACGALDDARGRQVQVVPHCPFIRDFISKHDEYRDLVPESVRSSVSL